MHMDIKKSLFFFSRKWYTSGRLLNEAEQSFFWEGDGSNITGSIYWLDADNIGTGDRIVYAYAGKNTIKSLI